MTFGGNIKTTWVNVQDFKTLDTAGYMQEGERILNSEQLLDEELKVLVKKFDDYGFTVADEVVWFSETGQVDDPVLFEKVLNGIPINTEDYYITLAKERP